MKKPSIWLVIEFDDQENAKLKELEIHGEATVVVQRIKNKKQEE